MAGALQDSGDLAQLPAQLTALRDALAALSAQVADVTTSLDEASRLMNQADRSEDQHTSSDQEASSGPITRFSWESDPDGTICWVEGAPRGSIIGRALPTMASARGSLRDVVLHLSGCDRLEGQWTLCASPAFDPRSGRFLGHRGEARRDHAANAPLPPDMMRQLVHEIRTPLNAIMGFAGMIDGEHLGPADPAYRARAAEIVAQATRVLETVEALDEEARGASACQTGGTSAIGAGPGEGL